MTQSVPPYGNWKNPGTIKPLSGKSPVEIQKEARTAAKTEKKPSIRAQLAQDKKTVNAAPKKQAAKSKNKGLEI